MPPPPPKRRRTQACGVCNNLDPRAHTASVYDSESKEKANASLSLTAWGSRLITSAADCRFCAVIVDAADALCGKSNKTQRPWRQKRVTIEIVQGWSVKVGVEDYPRKIEIYYSGEGGARPPWPTLGILRSLSLHGGSDDAFAFVNRCIRDCLSNPKHKRCNLPLPPQLPTRLIAVNHTGGQLRLCEQIPKGARYVALSHCWGDQPTLTTTIQNLQQRKSNIKWDSLPPLFQDAVTITRRLDVPYLWVDSLCIIQDSRGDWEREAASMSSIYENSHVTIAATLSPDSHSPCLQERQKPCQLTYTNTKGKQWLLKGRTILEQHPCKSTKNPASPIGPLSTRAWALQEHVLCVRILHYTSTELLFECRSVYRCECCPSARCHTTTPGLISTLSSAKQSRVWNTWHRIVMSYSRRALTVSSDKLPAISGIAYRFQGISKSAFLAGIWQKNLAHDLLWTMDSSSIINTSNSLDPVPEYRAPSWSWASLDTPISYTDMYGSAIADEQDPEEDSDGDRITVNVLKASTTLKGLNPFGEITEGFIILKGLVIESILVASTPTTSCKGQSPLPNPRYSLRILSGSNTSYLDMTPDCLLTVTSHQHENLSTEEESAKSLKRTVYRSSLAEKAHVPVNFEAPVLCIQIKSRGTGGTWVEGLVISPSRKEEGAYERVGMFAASSEMFSTAKKSKVKII